jgi:hypothetical protein
MNSVAGPEGAGCVTINHEPYRDNCQDDVLSEEELTDFIGTCVTT